MRYVLFQLQHPGGVESVSWEMGVVCWVRAKMVEM